MTDMWKTLRIADWGEVRGGRQRSPRLTAGSMRPYLRVANVFDSVIDISDVNEMLFTDAEFAQYALRPGDILLNEGQSSELVGRSAIYNGPAGMYAFQNTLVRFRAGPECDTVFAHALFRKLWHDGVFERISKKTTSIAHLGVTRFANLQVRIPRLDIQRRFGAALQRLSEVGRGAELLLSMKRALKRGLMHQLLTGSRRFQEFGQPASPQDVVPSDWSTRKLGELGRIVSGGTPSTREASYWDGRIAWCTPTDITRLREPYISKTERTITESGVAASSAEVLPAGSVIVCTRATVGAAAINRVPMATNQGFKSIVPFPDVSAEFVYYLIRHNEKELVRRGAGSTFLEVSGKSFASITVSLPDSRAEQERIAGLLLLIDREILLLEQFAQRIESQERAVMRCALSGDHVVPELSSTVSELAHA